MAKSNLGSNLGLSLLALAGGVLVWWIVAVGLQSILLPTPWSTVKALLEEFGSSSGRSDILTTLLQIVEGFAAGSVGGAVLGIGIGLSRVARYLIEPYQQFLRFVTPIAWITPVTLWLGIGNRALLALVIYATVFPVSINTASGVNAVRPDRIRMARSFAKDAVIPILRRVVLPSTVPQLVTGMRIGLSYAFMTVIGLEMLMGSNGLGNQIYEARTLYQSNVMMAGLILLGMMGFGGDRMFEFLRRTLLCKFEFEEN